METIYNSNLAVLERINKLIDSAHDASRIDTHEGRTQWFQTLRILERETIPYLDDSEASKIIDARPSGNRGVVKVAGMPRPSAPGYEALSRYEVTIKRALINNGLQYKDGANHDHL